LAAAQLSTPLDRDTSVQTSDHKNNGSNPTLPDFSAMLPALEHALNSDSFWGPGTYSHLLTRSARLATGIHDLINQCSALEALVTSAPPSPTESLESRRGSLFNTLVGEKDEKGCAIDDRTGKEMRLKRSKLAKRQMRLKEEQKAMIMRMAWQCWSVVQLPAEQRMAARAMGRKEKHIPRRRTLTCP
jgi:hypothetical protein